jgi:hypothetical protein
MPPLLAWMVGTGSPPGWKTLAQATCAGLLGSVLGLSVPASTVRGD